MKQSAVELELILQDHNRAKKIILYFTLRKTPIAILYFLLVRNANAAALPIGENRTYNFPGDFRDKKWIAGEINRQIDIINAYSPGEIKHFAAELMSQKDLNQLHLYFERLCGPIEAPSDFHRRAPKKIKFALKEYNTLIHRYEDTCRNEDFISQGSPPMARMVFSFLNDRRILLEDSHYTYFTRRFSFGTWYINYCEIGKPLFDVFQDDDTILGNSNIKPLRYFSSAGAIRFSPDTSEEALVLEEKKFKTWWAQNESRLSSLGFSYGDPKNALGYIPVADLHRNKGEIAKLNNAEILELLGKYPHISHVTTNFHDQKNNY